MTDTINAEQVFNKMVDAIENVVTKTVERGI